MLNVGHVVFPGPGGHGDLSPKATGLHSNYTCVVLGKHCGWSTEAAIAIGVKLKWVFHVVSQKAGAYLVLSFLVRGTFSSWGFPLVAKQRQLRGWNGAGKMHLPFLCGYSQVFSSTVAEVS